MSGHLAGGSADWFPEPARREKGPPGRRVALGEGYLFLSLAANVLDLNPTDRQFLEQLIALVEAHEARQVGPEAEPEERKS